MSTNEADTGLLLKGLDGSNPLGFLATVGVAIAAEESFPGLRIGWKRTGSGWRPSLQECGVDDRAFSELILQTLRGAPTTVFDIDNKMPFDAGRFSDALRAEREHSSMVDRRNVDLLASMGTELYPDKKGGQFQDSKFRMVRSGDSAGQGLPFYAKANLAKLDFEHVHLTLFGVWDYRDDGYSLRWDPIGDQRYALRWRDPSKSKFRDGPGMMLAADCLAIEALRWFPTLPVGRQAETTGFQRISRREFYFVWPIWTPMLSTDSVRSLLMLPDLTNEPIDHRSLSKRGVQEVYRSQRIQQNQYYSNFLPAQPI